MKKMTAFCLAVMMSLSLFGCSQAQQVEGITIVDQGGRKVTLEKPAEKVASGYYICLLYTSPSPRDPKTSRMPSSA